MRRQPDPRQVGDSARGQTLDHASSRRDEPGLRATAQDGGRSLRDDQNPQRVREGPVVAGVHDGRERVHLSNHGGAVEPDERLADERVESLTNLAGNTRRAALDLDPVDRKE